MSPPSYQAAPPRNKLEAQVRGRFLGRQREGGASFRRCWEPRIGRGRKLARLECLDSAEAPGQVAYRNESGPLSAELRPRCSESAFERYPPTY